MSISLDDQSERMESSFRKVFDDIYYGDYDDWRQLLDSVKRIKPDYWTYDHLRNTSTYRYESDSTVENDIQMMNITHYAMITGKVPDCVMYMIMYFFQNAPDPVNYAAQSKFWDLIHPDFDIFETFKLEGVNISVLPTVSAALFKNPTHDTYKAFDSQDRIKINIDDAAFNECYSNPQNHKSAMIYYLIHMLYMFGVSVKQPVAVLNDVRFQTIARYSQFTDAPPPGAVPTVSKGYIERVRQMLEFEQDFKNGLLKFLLLKFEKPIAQEGNLKLKALFKYTVELPFRDHGMRLVKFLKNAASELDLSQEELVDKIEKLIVLRLRSQIESLKGILRLKEFYATLPEIWVLGKRFDLKYWRYGRFFMNSFFCQMSLHRNVELVSFLIGLLPPDQRDAQNITALSRKREVYETYSKVAEKARLSIWKIPMKKARKFECTWQNSKQPKRPASPGSPIPEPSKKHFQM